MTLLSILPPWGKASLKNRLLTYFFMRPGSDLYLRQIAAVLRVDPANLSRALGQLEKEGVFLSNKRGPLKYFSLNQKYKFYEELQSTIQKTAPAELAKETSRSAHLYVIAGPNGAGKTMFARKFLPEYLGCKTFINADLIARGIAPLDAEGAWIKAGRLLLLEIESASKKGIDFSFETTLSGKSYVPFLKRLIRAGYAIHVLFLWIPNVTLSLKRIAERVRRGGHHIPDDVAKRRFYRGIENLFGVYAPLLSSWVIFDNSGERPNTIAYYEKNRETILNQDLYLKIRKTAGVG
jgi:predicted ABC-type ATPase/predicted transcriptional regulator with HTH domain